MNIDSFLVINVAGPSGVGKTSVCTSVLEQVGWLRRSVSVTTRPPRAGERAGIDYHFVGDDEFQGMVERGEFVEQMQVYGARYGTSERFVNELRNVSGCHGVLLAIDWQGNVELKRRLPNVVSIMLVPPSLGVLEARLRGRGQDTDSVIARRLNAAVDELRQTESFDYLVVNDDLRQTVRAVASLCEAARWRDRGQLNNVLAGRHYQDHG